MHKLCKDCKHLRHRIECHASENIKSYRPNYVQGGPDIVDLVWLSAQFIRADPKLCGPDAAWYEPAQPSSPPAQAQQ